MIVSLPRFPTTVSSSIELLGWMGTVISQYWKLLLGNLFLVQFGVLKKCHYDTRVCVKKAFVSTINQQVYAKVNI